MSDLAAETSIANWRESPYNQWAFVNVDKVLHTQTIGRSEHARELDSQPKSFDTFQIDINGDKLDLDAFIEASETDGLIVLQHDKIVLEHYSRGNTKDSKHIMMSMTKSITGLLIGILQAQGKLHPEDPIIKYVPEIHSTIYAPITIRQCLDMRSGAHYSDNTHAYRCATGWNPESGSELHTNIHDFIANFNPPRAKHDGFEYVSVNTDLIGWVIERATGKNFGTVIQDLLWRPMGAENDALMTVDKQGSARAAGGMVATLRDIARVGELILDDGRDVVPSSWLRDIIDNGDREAFEKGSWATGFDAFSRNLAYRSYCFADKTTEVVMGLGIFGQILIVDRKNGIVMAKTGSQKEAVDFRMVGSTLRAWGEVQRILTM